MELYFAYSTSDYYHTPLAVSLTLDGIKQFKKYYLEENPEYDEYSVGLAKVPATDGFTDLDMLLYDID